MIEICFLADTTIEFSAKYLTVWLPAKLDSGSTVDRACATEKLNSALISRQTTLKTLKFDSHLSCFGYQHQNIAKLPPVKLAGGGWGNESKLFARLGAASTKKCWIFSVLKLVKLPAASECNPGAVWLWLAKGARCPLVLSTSYCTPWKLAIILVENHWMTQTCIHIAQNNTDYTYHCFTAHNERTNVVGQLVSGHSPTASWWAATLWRPVGAQPLCDGQLNCFDKIYPINSPVSSSKSVFGILFKYSMSDWNQIRPERVNQY